MAKLPYPEAVKKAKTDKVKENFMEIHIDARMVLPHKDGVLLMQALANAEKLGNTWSSSEPPIGPLHNSSISVSVMSAKRYEQHKIAALMGVSVSDVEQAEQQAAAAADNPTP